MIKNIKYLILILLCNLTFSQESYLGDGPYSQLIIRGVTLINGDGAPPRGPIDIVEENNVNKDIKVIAYPAPAHERDRTSCVCDLQVL